MERRMNFDGYGRPEAMRLAQRVFRKRKAELIMQFYHHPVTQEILAGAIGHNPSGTLDGVPDGDLFTFIGFEQGSDPIKPILEELESIKLGTMTSFKNRFSFEIIMPSARDIFEVTPMPWAEGRSWAEGIETGISGVGYYLVTQSESSRSGGALQSTKKVRGGRFKNTKYISHLLRQFVNSLNDPTI